MTLLRDKYSRGFDGCLDAILASGLLDEDVSHAQLVNLSLPWIIGESTRDCCLHFHRMKC